MIAFQMLYVPFPMIRNPIFISALLNFFSLIYFIFMIVIYLILLCLLLAKDLSLTSYFVALWIPIVLHLTIQFSLSDPQLTPEILEYYAMLKNIGKGKIDVNHYEDAPFSTLRRSPSEKIFENFKYRYRSLQIDVEDENTPKLYTHEEICRGLSSPLSSGSYYEPTSSDFEEEVEEVEDQQLPTGSLESLFGDGIIPGSKPNYIVEIPPKIESGELFNFFESHDCYCVMIGTNLPIYGDESKSSDQFDSIDTEKVEYEYYVNEDKRRGKIFYFYEDAQRNPFYYETNAPFLQQVFINPKASHFYISINLTQQQINRLPLEAQQMNLLINDQIHCVNYLRNSRIVILDNFQLFETFRFDKRRFCFIVVLHEFFNFSIGEIFKSYLSALGPDRAAETFCQAALTFGECISIIKDLNKRTVSNICLLLSPDPFPVKVKSVFLVDQYFQAGLTNQASRPARIIGVDCHGRLKLFPMGLIFTWNIKM